MRTKYKLSKKEKSEPMMMTWGRILQRVHQQAEGRRLEALVLKFGADLAKSKVLEGYFA